MSNYNFYKFLGRIISRGAARVCRKSKAKEYSPWIAHLLCDTDYRGLLIKILQKISGNPRKSADNIKSYNFPTNSQDAEPLFDNQFYFLPFLRLQSLQSIWRLFGRVLPPSVQGFM